MSDKTDTILSRMGDLVRGEGGRDVESLRSDLRSATRNLRRSVVAILLTGIFIVLVFDVIYLETGNKTWPFFLVDMGVAAVAGTVLAMLFYRANLNGLRKAYEAESALMSVTDISSDAVYCIDTTGVITVWSTGAERIFGYREPEILGQSIGLLLPEDGWEQDVVMLQPLLMDGFVTGHRTRQVRQSGEIFPAEASVSLLSDPEGDPAGLLMVVRDITGQARMEDELLGARDELELRVVERTAELVEANQRLESEVAERQRAEKEILLLNKELTDSVIELRELNKELEAFNYSVSHDLRTPLRAVDGFSRILATEHAAQLDEEGRRYLDLVLSNTTHMGQLIEDLLTFSRSGRQEIHRVDVDMAELASSVWAELRAGGAGERTRFVQGPMPPARGDRLLLHQVLANLLGNAVKFSADDDEPVVEVSGRAEAGHNVYTVRDNGVGFDMQYADRLFGVFQRLHSQEQFEGTGVGLALVQRIVHRHGGLVWGEGEPGKGASFSFTLPGAGSASEGKVTEDDGQREDEWSGDGRRAANTDA